MVGGRFKEHRTDVDGSEDDSYANDSQFPDALIVEDSSPKIKGDHRSSSKSSPLFTVLAPRTWSKIGALVQMRESYLLSSSLAPLMKDLKNTAFQDSTYPLLLSLLFKGAVS